jgi:hypothetical protein
MASDDFDFRNGCDGVDGKSEMRPVHVGASWFVDRGWRTGFPGLEPKKWVGMGGTGGGVPGLPGLGGGDRGRVLERGYAVVVEIGVGRSLLSCC